MLIRNKKGQFIQTSKTQRYKQKLKNGRQIGEHRHLFCEVLGINELPDNLVVHHLDCNGLNNDINNLALLTVTAHNRIHSHSPWNKGLSAKTNEKWDLTIKKAQENRFKTFLPKFKEAFELQLEGKKLKEIALAQGISMKQVSSRIKRYKNYLKDKANGN